MWWLWTSLALGANGDLLWGPGSTDRLIADIANDTPAAWGPDTTEVAEAIHAQAIAWRGTTYGYTYTFRDHVFDYTLSATPPAPHSTGFPFWTAMFQERTDSLSTRIHTFLVSWLLYGDPEDLDEAVSIARDLSQWPVWSDPDYGCYVGPACLDTAHAAMSVGWLYDAAKDDMDPADAALIREALATKGAQALASAVAFTASVDPSSNGPTLVAAGLGVAAAALLDDHPDAEAWFQQSLDLAEGYLAAQGTDGGVLEAHGYGAYAMDNLVRVLGIARDRGIPLANTPFLDNVADFYLSAMAPDGTLGTFGDSWRTNAGPDFAHYLAWTGDARSQGYLVRTGLIGDVNPITLGRRNTDLAPQGTWLGPYASPTSGHAALRSDEGPGQIVVVFKSGPYRHSVGHNQKDHLSLQLWAYGDWILGDPGYSSHQAPDLFRFFDDAIGHQTILVDAQGPVDKIGARIRGWGGGPGFGVVCGEATESYASGLATRVGRCVAVHPDGLAFVLDNVDSPVPREVQTLWHPKQANTGELPPEGPIVHGAGGQVAIRSTGTASLQDFALTDGWPDSVVLTHPLPGGTEVAIADAGFESLTLDDWQERFQDGSHSIDQTEAFAGTASGSITLDPQDAGYFYSQRFDVDGGDLVRAAAAVKTAVSGTGVNVRILFWSGGTYIGTTQGDDVTGTSGWHRRTVGGVAPAGADQASIALQFNGTGTAWFDEVTAKRWAAGSFAQTTHREGTLLVPMTQAVNTTFDRGLADWRPRTIGAEHTLDLTEGHLSAPSARCSSTTTEAGYYYGILRTVEPGDMLEASAWLKTDMTSGGARLRILFYDATGYLSSVELPHEGGTQDWFQHELAVVVPPNAVKANISLEYNGIGDAWFDEAEFANLTTSWEDPDGEIPAGALGGTHPAWTFDRGAASYEVINAVDAPTADGRLDSGVAWHGTTSSWMVDGTWLDLPDLHMELSNRGAVRVDHDGDDVHIQTGYVGQRAPLRGGLVEVPDTGGAVTVDGEPAWSQSANGWTRICWGEQPPGACAPVATTLHVDPLELVAGESAQVLARVEDQYGRPWTDNAVQLSLLPGLGSVAGAEVTVLVAGHHPGALTVTAAGLLAEADLSVLPGPAADLTLLPVPTQLPAGVVFVDAWTTDAYDNPTGDPVTVTLQDGGITLGDGWVQAGPVADVWPDAIQASAGSLTATTDFYVQPGPPAQIVLDPDLVVVAEGESSLVQADVFDAWDNAVPAAVSWSVAPSLGTVAMGDFTAAAGAEGVWSDALTATAGPATSSAHLVILAGSNTPPVSQSAELEVVRDTPTPLSLSAMDADGDALTWVLDLPPLHGSLTGAPPNFTYTPDADYVGEDLLVFHTTDGRARSASASVSIDVLATDHLALAGPTPGIAGRTNTFRVRRATPGATVHLMYGLAAGSGTVPGCATPTGLRNPTQLVSATTDATGAVDLSVPVPRAAEGFVVWFQVAEAPPCAVGNVVVHGF